MAKRGGTTRVPVELDRDESAPEHWLRSIRVSGFTVLMLGLLILGVIVLAPNLRILIEQRQAIAELEQSLEDANAAVDELTADVARWSDPAYIEAQARERLFYVFPGDVSYLVIGTPDVLSTSNGQPISDEIQTTKVDWVRTVLGSIYSAGLTEAPAAELVGPETDGAP